MNLWTGFSPLFPSGCLNISVYYKPSENFSIFSFLCNISNFLTKMKIWNQFCIKMRDELHLLKPILDRRNEQWSVPKLTS